MDYILHLFILITFYTMLAQSLNLAAGFTGLLSLAHAGFYGIGAYTTALFATRFGCPFWLNLLIGISLSGGISFLISLVALRTVDDYFIICTIGIQVIVFSLMNNLTPLTNGPMGVPGIPAISIFGMRIATKAGFLLLSVFFLVIIWQALKNMAASGFGRILNAIKEDEIYAQSIGKNVRHARIVAFAVSAMLAAIPGALYAHYVSFVDPGSFTVNESFFILSVVIVGGMGNLTGSFMAAAFMVLLPELLRFLKMPDAIAANMRQIFYGLVLVLVMMRNKNSNLSRIR